MQILIFILIPYLVQTYNIYFYDYMTNDETLVTFRLQEIQSAIYGIDKIGSRKLSGQI